MIAAQLIVPSQAFQLAEKQRVDHAISESLLDNLLREIPAAARLPRSSSHCQSFERSTCADQSRFAPRSLGLCVPVLWSLSNVTTRVDKLLNLLAHVLPFQKQGCISSLQNKEV